MLLNTITARCIRPRRGAALFKFRASPEARTGPALRSIQKPRHALCRDLPPPVRRYCPEADKCGGVVRLHRRISLFARTARAAAPQAAIWKHCRHRHEHRRASLARSRRARRALCPSRTTWRRAARVPGRSWALVTKTVMIVVQMGYNSAPRISQSGRAVSDLANFDPHLWVYDKETGEMLAEVRCRQTLLAPRSPT